MNGGIPGRDRVQPAHIAGACTGAYESGGSRPVGAAFRSPAERVTCGVRRHRDPSQERTGKAALTPPRWAQHRPQDEVIRQGAAAGGRHLHWLDWRFRKEQLAHEPQSSPVSLIGVHTDIGTGHTVSNAEESELG